MNETGSFYRIHIRKEALKFAAAHMTVFADGTKENLHGHNYRTEISLEFRDFSLNRMLAFSELKQAMKEICQAWDEKIFLPELCPYLEILSHDPEETELRLCGKRYVFPEDEVVWLPVETITTETLAERFSAELVARTLSLLDRGRISRLEVRIDEMTGQGASFVREYL